MWETKRNTCLLFWRTVPCETSEYDALDSLIIFEHTQQRDNLSNSVTIGFSFTVD